MKEMRRKDRQLSENEARHVLSKGEYGILATIGDEYPYAVPLNYVVLNNSIYIHGTCEESQKIENIQSNCHVCFSVVDNTQLLSSKFTENYESVIVYGKASLSKGEEKISALKEFIYKYSSEYKESGMKYIEEAKDIVDIYKISIDKITGKARR